MITDVANWRAYNGVPSRRLADKAIELLEHVVVVLEKVLAENDPDRWASLRPMLRLSTADATLSSRA
jgi:hypothetical protein